VIILSYADVCTLEEVVTLLVLASRLGNGKAFTWIEIMGIYQTFCIDVPTGFLSSLLGRLVFGLCAFS